MKICIPHAEGFRYNSIKKADIMSRKCRGQELANTAQKHIPLFFSFATPCDRRKGRYNRWEHAWKKKAEGKGKLVLNMVRNEL